MKKPARKSVVKRTTRVKKTSIDPNLVKALAKELRGMFTMPETQEASHPQMEVVETHTGPILRGVMQKECAITPAGTRAPNIPIEFPRTVKRVTPGAVKEFKPRKNYTSHARDPKVIKYLDQQVKAGIVQDRVSDDIRKACKEVAIDLRDVSHASVMDALMRSTSEAQCDKVLQEAVNAEIKKSMLMIPPETVADRSPLKVHPNHIEALDSFRGSRSETERTEKEDTIFNAVKAELRKDYMTRDAVLMTVIDMVIGRVRDGLIGKLGVTDQNAGVSSSFDGIYDLSFDAGAEDPGFVTGALFVEGKPYSLTGDKKVMDKLLRIARSPKMKKALQKQAKLNKAVSAGSLFSGG